MSDFRRWLFRAAAVCAAAGLLAACGAKKEAPAPAAPAVNFAPVQVIGLGRIEPELRILDLQSEVSGIAVRIPVKAGETVAAGQVLVELSSAIENARLELKAAQARSERSQVEAAKAAAAAVRFRVENARLSLDRARALFEQNAQAKAPYDAAKADYEAQREDVKRLEAGIVAAEDVLKQSEADVRLSQAEFDRRFLRAPADGQVLSLDIAPGALVVPEKAVGTFAPKSPLVARCEIDEMFAARVAPGQRAEIRAPGMTDVLARGIVSFAGPQLRRKSLFSDEVGSLEDRRVREVWIALDPGAALLFGTRIEAVIKLKEK
jgi:multidrug efflux pump subunit AcrA (membrane-fusion protein)